MNMMKRFLSSEAKGGIILFAAAVVALVLSNSPAASFYQAIWQTPLKLHLSSLVEVRPLLFWVNEGLMALFFLLVGLELKREFLIGHLSNPRQIVLPGMAALGGMLLPALIYVLMNKHSAAALKGWAIPVATDIAFALGILSLLGKRIPLSLRLFLLVLAIFDDLGAIIIIAVFHNHALSWAYILLAGFNLLVLMGLNKAGVRHLLIYVVLGALLWVCVLQSGIHATVAGVLLALVIPLSSQPTSSKSPLLLLEEVLQPWVAYFVLPLFAFANAGLSCGGLTKEVWGDSVTLGIIAGLFLGKQSGVFGFAWLMIKLGWAKLPQQATWSQLYGVAVLCGIGFTMSLFIGVLAFQAAQAAYLVKIQLGVLTASMLSGLVGAIVLLVVSKKQY